MKYQLRHTPAKVGYLNTDRNGIIKKFSFYNVYEYNAGRGGVGINNIFEANSIGDDKIVTDKATDLMWQQAGSKTSLTYDAALNYINELNKNKFAGFADWRLPTFEEAYSLMKKATKNNNLHIALTFSPVQKYIWTCDYADDVDSYYGIYFNAGYDMLLHSSYDHWVRAVRVM